MGRKRTREKEEIEKKNGLVMKLDIDRGNVSVVTARRGSQSGVKWKCQWSSRFAFFYSTDDRLAMRNHGNDMVWLAWLDATVTGKNPDTWKLHGYLLLPENCCNIFVDYLKRGKVTYDCTLRFLA